MKKIINNAIMVAVLSIVTYLPSFADDMSSKKLEERLQNVEARLDRGGWIDRFVISGVLEAEAGTTIVDSTGTDTDESDIVLATAELCVAADIAENVSGVMTFLWEEGDTEPVDMDQGYITFEGGDKIPLYLSMGKLYVPFGNYESHMVSDPMTLEIGETSESAIQAGFENSLCNINIAVFNGDVDEAGEDDVIKTFAGSAQFTLPQDSVKNLSASVGVSFISNISDSDGLEGEVATADGTIKDPVAGMGAFMSCSFMEKFFIEAEYIGAIDEFEAGELFDNTGTEKYQPAAYNLEVAAALTEAMEMAFCYQVTEDVVSLPETLLGGAVIYSVFENTAISLEYLHGEFKNDDKVDSMTVQVAVEF